MNEGNIDKAAENKRDSESKEEKNESNKIKEGFSLILTKCFQVTVNLSRIGI